MFGEHGKSDRCVTSPITHHLHHQVMNLIVLTALRQRAREQVVGVTTLLLANLCLANLTSATLVKSIAVVHNG